MPVSASGGKEAKKLRNMVKKKKDEIASKLTDMSFLTGPKNIYV